MRFDIPKSAISESDCAVWQSPGSAIRVLGLLGQDCAGGALCVWVGAVC